MGTPWFALQTRPRNEKRVEFLLTQKGYECFLPTYKQQRRWSYRMVEVVLPLFPMYIFCRFDEMACGKAILTPGVIRIVGFGGHPTEVPIKEIEALQLLNGSDLLREPWAYLPNGTLIQVETGPLAGVQGVLCSVGDRRHLVVSINLLQRSVAVHLDDDTMLSVVEVKKEKPKKEKNLSYYESELAMMLVKKARS